MAATASIITRTTKTTAKAFILTSNYRRHYCQYHVSRRNIISAHTLPPTKNSLLYSAPLKLSSSFSSFSSSCCSSFSSSSSSSTTTRTASTTRENVEKKIQDEDEAITMKLLKAARGQSIPSSSLPPLKCFPLSRHHFGSIPSSPSSNDAIQMSSPTDFHSYLCKSIQNAKKRVLLASLYIGPAIHKEEDEKEEELLNSIETLASKNSNVKIQIIMDAARGNRKISFEGKDDSGERCTSSSAKAIHDCIQRGRSVRKRSMVVDNHDEEEKQKDSGGGSGSGVYLFPAVDEAIRKWLPSPLDEAAGVFHIKAYIIDDSLLLSGANLSEVYFTRRQDRYMLFVNGGGGLVDFYADLINILCNYADEYKEEKVKNKERMSIVAENNFVQELDTPSSGLPFLNNFSSRLSHLTGYSKTITSRNDHNAQYKRYESRHETLQKKKMDLLASLSDLFDGSNDDIFVEKGHDMGNDTIAYAVPTLQLPASFIPSPLHSSIALAQDQHQNGKNLLPFPSDDSVTKNLLLAAIDCDPKNASVRLSSAYLNPTTSLMSALKMFGKDSGTNYRNAGATYLLTAGLKSHGFALTTKAKSKRGDKVKKTKMTSTSTANARGRGWIPKAYAELVKEAASHLTPMGGKVLLYDKECWSFHAKGLWLSFPSSYSSLDHGGVGIERPNEYISNQSKVRATIVGSGNYGARSEDLDIESNCIMIMRQIPTHDRLDPYSSQNNPLSFVESQASDDALALDFQEKDHQSGCHLLQSLVAEEWNDLCRHSSDLNAISNHESLGLAWKGAFQYLRRFL